jgi:hypothetical protein
MTPQQIKDAAPEGATHYDTDFKLYLKLDKNNFGYSWVDNEWFKLMQRFPVWHNTKPL